MEHMPRTPDRYLLSEQDNQELFDYWIAQGKFSQLESVTHPTVHFFGGQPGAGKSSMQDPIISHLHNQDGAESVAQVIGDEFRIYHPMYTKLLEHDDNEAAFYTDRDSGKWIEKSIDLVVNKKSHLVLEGTLRNPDVTLKTAALCTANNYEANLHVVAVHEFISRARIFHRYIGQIHAGGNGRYTLPESHSRAYDMIPTTVEALARSQQFSAITLYDANGETIARQHGSELKTPQQLLETLDRQRDTVSIDYTQLLEDIDNLLEQLGAMGRPAALNDLQLLKIDVERSIT